MPLSHLLLALAVVAVWGANFVVIKGALTDLPPLLLAEPLPLWKLAAAGMVMGGLGLSVFSARRSRTVAFMTGKSYPAIWRP